MYDEIERPNPSKLQGRRLGGLIALTAMLIGLSACAGIEAAPRGERTANVAAVEIASPERQHATVEGAALHALAEAWKETRSSNRDRLRVGSIVRINGAHVWLEPEAAKSASRSVVRVKLDAGHAATYIIHPRTDTLEASRANEQITKHEKRLVDRVDPLHRPIYVLTPSGRLLTYAHGEEWAELVSMRDHEQYSAASRGIRVAGVAETR